MSEQIDAFSFCEQVQSDEGAMRAIDAAIDSGMYLARTERRVPLKDLVSAFLGLSSAADAEPRTYREHLQHFRRFIVAYYRNNRAVLCEPDRPNRDNRRWKEL